MTGRWPANVILSPGMAQVLDGQSGTLKSGARNGIRKPDQDRAAYGAFCGGDSGRDFASDAGGASRFFLNAGYEPWELEWILANGLRPCGA